MGASGAESDSLVSGQATIRRNSRIAITSPVVDDILLPVRAYLEGLRVKYQGYRSYSTRPISLS